ncbi:MAG: hypothetical protein H0W89_02380 [Candidatus Levybacteria bacterium]|nr:hypothetical protein [Candidatus Levybacteria bacterium]
MPKKQQKREVRINKPMMKAGITMLVLIPVLFFTVSLLQQPQTMRQFAAPTIGDDPTAPGPVCDANTVLPPEQRAILEEVCKIDYATDACKDFCKRTERPESDCAVGGPFGPPPPPPPPPPPVVKQPGNARPIGGTGARTPVGKVKSPGTKPTIGSASRCSVNSQCTSGFCNLSNPGGPKCDSTRKSILREPNLDFCTLNPNHASCAGKCGNGKTYVPGGQPGFGYCK